jgi:signal transduction histidine kinase
MTAVRRNATPLRRAARRPLPFLAGIILMVCIQGQLGAQSVRASFIPDLPPFSFRAEDGSRTGFYIELLDALASDIGFDVEYVEGSWGENFSRGREGSLDLLISVTYTAEREAFLDYTEEPVISAYTQVVRRRGTGIESVLDLDGRRVGIMAGDSNGAAFVEFVGGFGLDIDIAEYPGYPALLGALFAGEIEAGAMVNLFNLDGYQDVDRTSIVFNAFATSFASAKGTNAELLETINERILAWKSDPSSPYYDIFSHYFGSGGSRPLPPWLVPGVAVLLVFTITSWVLVRILTGKLRQANAELAQWNARLEDRVERRSRELDDSRRKLMDAEKMASLGNMVAGVAHEINTPIGVALTASSFLNDHVRTLEKQYGEDQLSKEHFQEFLENARESALMINGNLSRAANLIQSFKEVSIDQTLDEPRRINIRDYAESVLKNLYPRIKRTGFRYRLEAPDVELLTQPGSLAQILTNLFENSLTHGFADAETGCIDIRFAVLEGERPRLELVFADDGGGIDETVRDRIFEPFVSSRKFEGSSGLGMSIVHNIVTKKLGGEISFSTSPDTGTEFLIIFPVDA